MNSPKTNAQRPPRGGNDVEERARQERRDGAIDDVDGGGFPPATVDGRKEDDADPAVNGDPTRKRNEAPAK